MSRRFRSIVAVASLVVCSDMPRAGAQPAPAGAVPAPPAPGVVAAPEVVDDPAVKALLATKPSTPRDLFRVVDLLAEMGYPKVAKPLLTKLAEVGTDEKQLAEIGRQFGRPAVDRLGASPAELQPEARQMADRIIAATRNEARSPERIGALIALLKDPSYDARINAMMSLRAGEDASVDALLTVLLDPARQAEHAQVRTALAVLDHYAVGPLAAMAGAPDEAVRVSALKALTLFGDAESLAPLYAAAFVPGRPQADREAAESGLAKRLKKLPQPAEAAADLYVTARSAYLRRAPAAQPGAEAPTTTVWKWDDAAKRPVAAQAPERIAELDRAGRLARTASEILGQKSFARHLAWAAELESGIVTAGPDPKARAAAAAAWSAGVKPSATDLEGLLEFAMESDRGLVAAETVRVLATVGGVRALESPIAGKPSPLVRAATHPDRRVRFAAVESILALRPTAAFNGSSGVFDAVGYFAGSTGARKALVVDFSPARARNVGGLLAGLDYRIETALSTRDAVRMLAQDPDIELVLVTRTLLTPEQGGLLGKLRADYRTRRLPVAVYCGADETDYARTLLGDDEYASAIYEPRTFDTLGVQLAAATNLQEGAALFVPAAERLAQATAILTAAAPLLDANHSVLNLRPYEARLTASVWHPAVAGPLAAVLGKLGSPAAQRTLADVASSSALPLEQRRAASQAFCESVIRFGTLLTTVEVRRQYDRYNASETLDRETQELLAAMLDVMEARVAKIPTGADRPAGPSTSSPPSSPSSSPPGSPAGPAAP